MGHRIIIGVMGAGKGAAAPELVLAEQLGELIASQGWVLLTGGRDQGIMAAANRGAKRVAGSLTVGILPSESAPACPDVDVPIFTGLGSARNAVNVLSSRVVVVCGRGGPGTISEAALALKAGRPLVLLAPAPEAEALFCSLGGDVRVVQEPREAVAVIRQCLPPEVP